MELPETFDSALALIHRLANFLITETGVPVISAVLTPHQFQETKSHEKFFGEHFVTKGEEAADACLKIIANFAKIVEADLEPPGQISVTAL